MSKKKISFIRMLKSTPFNILNLTKFNSENGCFSLIQLTKNDKQVLINNITSLYL